MKHVFAGAIVTMALMVQASAQSCDTLGGGVNCNTGRSEAGNSKLFEKKAAPRTPGRTIGQDPETYKIIENDTSVDPYGRPKATLGGTTFYGDGRKCTRIGLTVTCK